METTLNMDIYELVILAVLGLVVLLCGYRVKKLAFFIIWFLLGFNLVSYFMPTLTSWVPQIAGNALWENLLPIGGGLLLALMGFSIEKLCLGGACFALVLMITMQYFGTEIQTIVIGAIVGVLAAGLAVTLMKPATIVATAVAGAYALTLVILSIWTGIDYAVWYYPILLMLAAVGSVFQFATSKDLS